MRPEVTMHSRISKTRGRFPRVSDTSSALLGWLAATGEQTSRATAARDVVAVTRAGSALDRVLRAVVAPDLLFTHPPLVANQDAGAAPRETSSDPSVLLADRDRDIRGTSRAWIGTTRPPERLYRADTLYGDTHAVALLALDGPPDPISILRGAARILRDHQPILVIDLATVRPGDRSRLWEECVAVAGGNYQWHDGWTLPCVTRQSRRDVVRHCANTVACAIPGFRTSVVARGVAELLTPDGSGFASFAWDSAGWCDIDNAGAPVTVRFGQELATRGMYEAERDGNGACWRWTGPGTHSAFVLPRPRAGFWRLTLRSANWGTVGQADDLFAYADGERLILQAFERSAAIFSLPIANRPGASGCLTIDLATPRPRRASSADPRLVGACLTACVLEPAPTR